MPKAAARGAPRAASPLPRPHAGFRMRPNSSEKRLSEPARLVEKVIRKLGERRDRPFR